MAERLGSEEWSIIATIDPDQYATNTATLVSDVWDWKNFSKVMAIIQVGDFGTSASLAGKLQVGVSSATFSTIGTGKKITALTEAGSDDDKQVIINCNAAEAGSTGGRYGRLFLGLTKTTSFLSAIVLGKPVRNEAYTSISAKDLSSVDEIVA